MPHFFSKALFLLLAVFILPIFGETAPDFTLHVPMRDGATLATDIYLPTPESKGLPCLLVRTPVGRREIPAIFYIPLAKAGFVVAIQETRSAADPLGQTMPCITDGWGPLQDGYDAVEWLAHNPLTNGKVGTLGVSALGISQLMLAPSAPPSLVAQYIQFAAGSIYHDAAYPSGQLQKDLIENWLTLHSQNQTHLDFVKSQCRYNDFWELMNSHKKAHQVTAPALFIAGWFDVFLQGTLRAYKARQQEGGPGAKGNQKLVIGPWSHFWPHSLEIGDFKVPKEGQFPPYDISPTAWFNHYLKGEKNGIAALPPVLYYVTGPFDGSPSKGNRWKEAQHWPPIYKEKTFYLTKNGALSPTIQDQQNEIDSFFYDPEVPIITQGGRNLFLESGPKDQRAIESRNDILLYTSRPFQEDFEIGGPVKLVLFFSTSAHDTDIAVRLTDVYPDGKSILLSDATYRLMDEENPVSFIEKDLPHEIEIDLDSLAHVFAKGHSLRLSISSSNYPRFEKNLNIAAHKNEDGASKIATNRVHRGAATPSCLILPETP